jgi:predicted dehydrogenase
VLKEGVTKLPMDRIKGTTSASKLIAMKDVEIVDVCVPTTQHVDVAIEAINAGKHVLCE